MSLIELTADQEELQRAAFAFAHESLASDMVTRDRDRHFDRDAWRRCADFGVLGMPVPKEYGGLGLGLTDLLAVMEGLGRGTRDQGLLFSLNAHSVDQADSDSRVWNRGTAPHVSATALRRDRHRELSTDKLDLQTLKARAAAPTNPCRT